MTYKEHATRVAHILIRFTTLTWGQLRYEAIRRATSEQESLELSGTAAPSPSLATPLVDVDVAPLMGPPLVALDGAGPLSPPLVVPLLLHLNVEAASGLFVQDLRLFVAQSPLAWSLSLQLKQPNGGLPNKPAVLVAVIRQCNSRQ